MLLLHHHNLNRIFLLGLLVTAFMHTRISALTDLLLQHVLLIEAIDVHLVFLFILI